jgi:molecular chaperone GrpE
LSLDKHARQEGSDRSAATGPGAVSPSAEPVGTTSAPDAGTTAEVAANKSGADRIPSLEAEIADLKDKYLRKYADFENYKKRMTREREDSAKYSNAMLLLDIVNIIDNFERAIKSAEDGKDFKNFHTGISMIEKQLVTILENKWGVERFYAKGQLFDPERHEALMAEQSADVETATVAEDLQSGYLLHGKVLRPAKVKVKQPVTAAETQPPTGQTS